MDVIKKYEKGQNIIDFVISAYGNEDYLLDFLDYNEIEYTNFGGSVSYKVDKDIRNGDYIIEGYNLKSGNEDILYRLGDYNKDYNGDFFNQDILETSGETTTWWTIETPTGLTLTDGRVSIDENFTSLPLYGWVAPKSYLDGAGFLKMSNYNDYGYDNRVYYEDTFLQGKYLVTMSGVTSTASMDLYIKFVNDPYTFNLNVDSFKIPLFETVGVYGTYTKEVEVSTSARYFVIEVRSATSNTGVANVDRVIVKKI